MMVDIEPPTVVCALFVASVVCRERKLPSSCVLITPGVASGQHFIFGQLRSLPSYRSTKKYFNRAFPSSRHAFRFLLTEFTEDSFLIVYSRIVPTNFISSTDYSSTTLLLRSTLTFRFDIFSINSPIYGKGGCGKGTCPCIWNCQRASVPTGVPFTAVSLNESSPPTRQREVAVVQAYPTHESDGRRNGMVNGTRGSGVIGEILSQTLEPPYAFYVSSISFFNSVCRCFFISPNRRAT